MTKSPETVVIGTFFFDPRAEALTDATGSEVALRPQTLRVLAILAAARGALVSKDSLMEQVWSDTHVTDDSLVQCVSEIRKVLGARDGKLLKTVPKQGYRLEVSSGAAPAARPSGRPLRWGRRGLALLAGLLLAAIVVLGWRTFGPAPNRDDVTVAVLPFANLSTDPGQDYMAVGLAEDLRVDLARSGGLTVLSRGTTEGTAGGVSSDSALFAARGVTHVVDGSVQRDGEHLRVSVSLVNARTGATLWAERYDRTLGDIFAVQDDVRGRILKALSVRLHPGAEALIKQSRTAQAKAYDLLLQGRYHEAALSRTGVNTAAGFYEQAIAVDPGYADAHARLANMYDFQARFGWTDDTATARRRAIEEAETAVRLAPNSPFAHWTLGRVTARLDPGPKAADKAIAAFDKAVELDPNYADAYGFLALVLIGSGHPEKAVKAIDRAFVLNAEPPSWYLQNRGVIHYFRGDYGNAIADFETSAEKNPTASYVHLWLAAAYAMADRPDDADWEVSEAQSLGDPWTVSTVVAANSVIRYEPYREAYAEGLRRAGLPD